MEEISQLNQWIAVEEPDFSQCIDVVESSHEISGISATVRLHCLKFNANGEPMVDALANKLYDYIIDYCLSAKDRAEPLTNRQAANLTKQARQLFRRPEITDASPDRTGEAGEVLLFFLIEAVLRAPQVVAKMELKTNHNDEVKGSDGIHAKWNEEEEIVEFFFGESKLRKSASKAISSLIDSINGFHEVKMYEHEFNIVTKHFKYAHQSIKSAIEGMIINGEPGDSVRINHACLIGYDFSGYSSAEGKSRQELKDDFCKKLLKHSDSLVESLQRHFDEFEKKQLVFEVFFLPFPSVDEFRNSFNRALG